MIAGRPSNLILGALTAILNVAVLVLAALNPPIVVPAAVVSGVNLALAAIIAVIANQPPTVSPGDKVTVQTEAGQPNYTTTIATPPKQDPPPEPQG